jgi:hypothetical protein
MPDRAIPGLDAGGFIALTALRGTARRLKLEDFSRIFFAPALLVTAIDVGDEVEAAAGVDPSEVLSPVERSFRRTMTESDGGDASAYHEKVAFLAKRPGNPFPDMVSIGRAMNSDIVVSLGTISKVHGFFRNEKDGWSYSDAQSTNGTLVDGKRLESGSKASLRDGTRIRFGLEIVATLLLPESIYDRARR